MKFNIEFKRKVKETSYHYLKESVQILIDVTESYGEKYNLKTENTNLYLLKGRITGDERNRREGLVLREEFRRHKLEASLSLISLTDEVAEAIKEEIEIQNLFDDYHKIKNSREHLLVMAILLTTSLIGAIVINLVNIKNFDSSGVILVGSGSVYSHFQQNYGEIFHYDTKFPKVTVLENPSNIGLDVIIHSYKRGEPISKIDSLPSIIGMYSDSLNGDTIIRKEKNANTDSETKYYGIQIGTDALRCIIGCKKSISLDSFLEKQFSIKNGNQSMRIDLNDLKTTIYRDHKNFHLITTSINGGTYASWKRKFGENIEKYRNIKEFNKSDDFETYIQTLDKPWLLFCSDDSKLDSFKNKDIPQSFSNFKVSDNSLGIDLIRPLYLFGKFNPNALTQINNGNKIYQLDKSVCMFWEKLIGLMENRKDSLVSKNAKNIKNDFMTFSNGSNKNYYCGIRKKLDTIKVDPKLILYNLKN